MHLLGAVLAILFRVNLPISVLVTLYSNPFTIVPLYLVAYGLGQLVLPGHEGPPSFPPHFAGKSIGEWLSDLLHWLTSMGKPLMVGLPLLALLFAVVGYFTVDCAWRVYVRCTWQRRRKHRLKKA